MAINIYAGRTIEKTDWQLDGDKFL